MPGAGFFLRGLCVETRPGNDFHLCRGLPIDPELFAVMGLVHPLLRSLRLSKLDELGIPPWGYDPAMMKQAGLISILLSLTFTGSPGIAQQAVPVERLIEKLRSNDPAVREEGTRGLKEAGKRAETAVRKAAQDGNLEVAARAKAVLRFWEVRE